MLLFHSDDQRHLRTEMKFIFAQGSKSKFLLNVRMLVFGEAVSCSLRKVFHMINCQPEPQSTTPKKMPSHKRLRTRTRESFVIIFGEALVAFKTFFNSRDDNWLPLEEEYDVYDYALTEFSSWFDGWWLQRERIHSAIQKLL